MGGDTTLWKHQVKVALFDLGGTLVYDDYGDWRTVYRQAEQALWGTLERAGIRTTPKDLYRGRPSLLEYYYEQRTGLEEPGIERVLEGLLESAGERLGRAQIRESLDAMFAVTQRNWHLEDDATATLATLRRAHIRLGVISNGSDDGNARRLLERDDLMPFFESVLTSAAFGRRKPDPRIFHAAMAHFGASAGEAVMVGDDYEADILGAAGIGIKAIWIRRRVRHNPVQVAGGASATVMSLQEVADLLT
jgi:HAD superfamily hydrolase (TIGR01549 family)